MHIIEQTAKRYTDAEQFCGIEWQLRKRGQLVSGGSQGFADATAKTPIPENALYRIYSMTKPIVSVAAMLLVQQQRLRLFDPVARYIPEFRKQKVLQLDGSLTATPNGANIEQLLTHRAGLSYDFLPDCKVAELYREMKLVSDASRSLHELCLCLAQAPAASVPGTEFRYSYATDVLARVIELVTGQTIGEYLQAELFAPLQMKDTGYHVNGEDRHRLMSMYAAKPLDEVMYPPPLDGSATQKLTPLDIEKSYPSDANLAPSRGGLGLFSTCDDYMKFAEFLHTGKTTDGEQILTPATFDMLWTNRIPASQMPIAVGASVLPGYGWNLMGRIMLDVGQAFHLTSQGEGGWAGAAATYFWVDRLRETTGVVMTQYLGSAHLLAADMHSAGSTDAGVFSA